MNFFGPPLFAGIVIGIVIGLLTYGIKKYQEKKVGNK